MSEIDYVITKDGIFPRADVKEYVRPISSKEELTDLIERMPYITTINAPNGKARRDLYDITMEKYEDVEWVRVIKSVYLRMKDHKYEDFEPQYMNKAKEFLYGEISKQFGMDIEDVEKFVCSAVKKSLDDF
jgi:CarD family transcriptional regulator